MPVKALFGPRVTGPNEYPIDSELTLDSNDVNVDTSLCKMIAWLSVCVLAAAWGSNLDPEWRPIWREIGAFGLVSAVGLSTARQLHSAYRRRVEQRTTEGLLERFHSTCSGTRSA